MPEDESSDILYGHTEPRAKTVPQLDTVELKMLLLQSLGRMEAEHATIPELIDDLRRETKIATETLEQEQVIKALTELTRAGYVTSFSMGVLPSGLYQLTDKGRRTLSQIVD